MVFSSYSISALSFGISLALFFVIKVRSGETAASAV